MIAVVKTPVASGFQYQFPNHAFKEHEPASWTCYNAGLPIVGWVMQAAEDASTSIDVLQMLAESCNLEVRMAVADNQSASVDTLMALAQDESDDLRYQLAENHNIDKSVLRVLADDSNPYIAYRANKTLRRLELKDGATIVEFPVFVTVPESTKELRQKLHCVMF